MARPLIRKYETLEIELFKAYDILSEARFKLYIDDGFMTVGCNYGLLSMNETKKEAWSSACKILTHNFFSLRIDKNGMLVHCLDNLSIMNDGDEGFCIIHESDLEDFDERQSELEDELDNEDN